MSVGAWSTTTRHSLIAWKYWSVSQRRAASRARYRVALGSCVTAARYWSMPWSLAPVASSAAERGDGGAVVTGATGRGGRPRPREWHVRRRGVLGGGALGGAAPVGGQRTRLEKCRQLESIRHRRGNDRGPPGVVQTEPAVD